MMEPVYIQTKHQLISVVRPLTDLGQCFTQCTYAPAFCGTYSSYPQRDGQAELT